MIPWLAHLSVPGVHSLLKRLGVTSKRGRVSVHSPDLLYEQKLAAIRVAQAACLADPEHIVFLYEDEHTFYRNPTKERCYASRGGAPHKASLRAGYDNCRRIAGCLDWRTGAVITMQRNHFPADLFAKFLLEVEAQYPQAQVIYVALDNWPVHFAPEVLQSLEEHKSRIRLLRLPTYAPWTNPIEKVWRLFNQEVTHMHRFATQWANLREVADDWLEAIRPASKAMLRAVGLLPKGSPQALPLHNP